MTIADNFTTERDDDCITVFVQVIPLQQFESQKLTHPILSLSSNSFISISVLSLSSTTIPSTQSDYTSFLFIKNDKSITIGKILTDGLEFSTFPISNVTGIKFCFDLQTYKDSTIEQPISPLGIHHLDIATFNLDSETGKPSLTFLGRNLDETKPDEGNTCVDVIHPPLYFFSLIFFC